MYCVGKYIVSPSHSAMWVQCIVLGNILCLPPIPQCGSNVLCWEIYCVSLPFHNVDPMYCVGKYIVSPSHSTMWIQCIVLGNILCLPPIPQCGSNVLYWEIYCVSLPFHNVDPMCCVGKYIVSPLPF